MLPKIARQFRKGGSMKPNEGQIGQTGQDKKVEPVTNEMIDAGKFFKKTVEYQGVEFIPHRLSIGEKIQVGVLQSRKLMGMVTDEYTSALANMAAWLDITLRREDNPEWQGADKIFNDDYLIGLYNICWEAVEKPFFRALPAKGKDITGSGK